MLDTKVAPPVTVTATGVICQLGVEDCQPNVGVLIAGTFTATVLVEVCYDPGAASPTWVQFGSPVSAAGTVKVDIPVKAVRARCSAFTSGSITAAIGALFGSV